MDRDYVALAKGFPALALMSEVDLAEDFGPFAAALEGALDPIVVDFRRQMVRSGVQYGVVTSETSNSKSSACVSLLITLRPILCSAPRMVLSPKLSDFFCRGHALCNARLGNPLRVTRTMCLET